ncbi:uncharacterized protein LOC117527479 isoform X2 [Thalassophryne amazonica]|uniref:uncharacterized protein LOC117527479 isoform X2 n=1 Tax=Thalassophryne amazonica TaxID=390379 RepID=UPI0014719D47|nr:uncharacterized protein LOC117527479 isoform X2 [Thalassophryne amazonica]
MPLSGDKFICPKFQPNIFDPSRCHDCLRQRHLHAGAGERTASELQHKSSADAGTAVKTGVETGTGAGSGSVKGVLLTPVPSQAEERDTSSKEDSDGLSVVSSNYDVSGGCLGYDASSLCILSPDCELYICEDDDSTDSCLDQSDYQELSGCGSTEDEYLPIYHRSIQLGMTRLDPPPHRPSPRAWMDEAQNRGQFRLKDEREKHASGYFSLGRAAGARSLRDHSPPAPFRHFERGHPLFSTRNIEPKDIVPFRNPNLGVASDRPIPEVLNEDLPVEIPPPDPYEVAIEVEAQVGPRSPSPTPFKIAESLASTGRKGFTSYGRGNSASHVTSRQQPGRFDSSRQGSALQSRSSSPSRGNVPFRSSESAVSLSRPNIHGGGDGSGAWSQRVEPGSRTPFPGAHIHRAESGTLPRNFKSFATSLKTQSSPISDFKSVLHKTDHVDGPLHGRGRGSRSSSPLRRDYDPVGQTTLHKTEAKSRSPLERQHDSRHSSPSRTYDSVHDSHSSSSPKRSCNSFSQSHLHRFDSVTSLNGCHHHGRCGSPIREGYDIENQALHRNPKTQVTRNDEEYESRSVSPTRKYYSTSTQPVLPKSEANVGNSRGQGSRCTSPGRRGNDTVSQHQLRKTNNSSSLNSSSRKSCNSSPSRKSHGTPSQALLQKSQTYSCVRSYDGHSSLPSRKGCESVGQSSLWKADSSRLVNSKNYNSDTFSPSRKGTSDPPGYSVLRNAANRDPSSSFQRKNTNNESRSDLNHSLSSWRESKYSLCSSSLSRATSPPRQPTNGRIGFITLETSRSPSTMRPVRGSEGFANCRSSPKDNRSSHRARSASPSPHIQMRRHTSSQSSLESSESGQVSLGSTRRNREEYTIMADLPKVKIIHQEEESDYMGHPQHCQPSRKQELFKPASHSLSKHPYREWENAGDSDYTGWHSGGLSRAQSSTSLQRSGSPTIEEGTSWKGNHHRLVQMQGWMSKLDESGEWKKHWFVLTDAGLKYYRDSGAEEKDDLDGEIDLKSCVKVSEFDVEKNYGFQIQTLDAVFTLSAMTAGIRRNWIEVLKKCVRPSTSPDLTQLPDSSSDKENSHSRSVLSSRRPSSRHSDIQPDVPDSVPFTQRRFDYVELSPIPSSSNPLPASQREAAEGQGREHSQWQEERSGDVTSSQWEALLSRKGPGVGSNQRLHVEDEIERKWAELERMPLKQMRSLPPMGSQSSTQSANEALQREVASLRQQLEQLKQGGGGGMGIGCGPDTSCGRSLVAMERAYRQALEELQKQHEREMKELETERDRLLLEETRATTQVMEALKTAHKEELEREVEKVKRLSSGIMDSHTMRTHQQAETQTLQRELAGLSERYSQKCLELNRAEQNNAEREREISRKERDMEQLRKENQDLKNRLMAEMSRMRSTITDQGTDDNRNKNTCELQVLLRVKENEIEYLHKEISCLRNELQFLSSEKRLACERYSEVNEELNGMKGRSEREIQSLKEHLRLAMAALQEGQMLGNSLDH